MADAAEAIARAEGLDSVALSGGCFQNALLLERLAALLIEKGLKVVLHRLLPPNDGGLSFGQAVAAAAMAARGGQ